MNGKYGITWCAENPRTAATMIAELQAELKQQKSETVENMTGFDQWMEEFNETMFGNKHGGYNACDFEAPNSRREDMKSAYKAGMLAGVKIVGRK